MRCPGYSNCIGKYLIQIDLIGRVYMVFSVSTLIRHLTCSFHVIIQSEHSTKKNKFLYFFGMVYISNNNHKSISISLHQVPSLITNIVTINFSKEHFVLIKRCRFWKKIKQCIMHVIALLILYNFIDPKEQPIKKNPKNLLDITTY